MVDALDRSLIRLSLILLAGAMAALLDTTMVSVAMAELSREFGAPPGTVQLVSTAYLLAMALVVPLMGWLVDRWGAKSLWMLSLAVFITGSVLCGTAWSAGSLIAFRALQGAGGGLILPLMQAILAGAAGPRRFGRAMSLVAIPGQLAPILGPVLGGAILDAYGWRWIFLIHLPLSLAALALAWRGLPGSPGTRSARLDLGGFLLLSPGLFALIYGLSLAGTSGSFLSPPAVPWLGTGAVTVLAFAVSARRKGSAALIDMGLLRHRPYAAAASLTFLFGIAIYGPMFLLPLYFEWVWGDEALTAGAMLAPQGAGTMLAIAFAGRWSDRLGPRLPVVSGMAATALATLAFAGLGASPDRGLLAASLFVRGLGLGMAGIPAMGAAYHGLEAGKIARATAGLNVTQRLGASFGTALLAVVLQRRLASVSAEAAQEASPAAAHAVDAFSGAFLWSVAFALVALAPALMLPRRTPAAER